MVGFEVSKAHLGPEFDSLSLCLLPVGRDVGLGSSSALRLPACCHAPLHGDND